MKSILVLLLAICGVLSYWIYSFNKDLKIAYHDNANLKETISLVTKSNLDEQEQIKELSSIILVEFAEIQQLESLCDEHHIGAIPQ